MEQTEMALRAEITRLNKVVTALMNRAELATSAQDSEFGQFQSTLILERLVQERTKALEKALQENEKINRAMQRAKAQLEEEKEEQRKLIRQLEAADKQLLQSEKLASIGQLAAGVAHEINNPIGFVHSNLGTLHTYADDLLRLIDAYEAVEPRPSASSPHESLDQVRRQIDLPYLREDIVSLIAESIAGTARVRKIVQDLRDFAWSGPVDWAPTDLHAGLESTINLAWIKIKSKLDIIREYGNLPLVECIPSQINQVFMNLLVNAAQATPEHGTVTLRSGRQDDKVWVSISDTGAGIPEALQTKIFDPFFTTKVVGQGTGLGLSLAYGIIHKHGGHIQVVSQPGHGATFTIWLPIQRPPEAALPG